MKHNLEESPSGRKTSMCWFLVWFSLLFIFLVPGEEALLSLKPEWAPDLEHWVGNSPQLKVLILFLMSSREAHDATAAILTGILSFIIVLICLGFFFSHKPGYPGPTFPGKCEPMLAQWALTEHLGTQMYLLNLLIFIAFESMKENADNFTQRREPGMKSGSESVSE